MAESTTPPKDAKDIIQFDAQGEVIRIPLKVLTTMMLAGENALVLQYLKMLPKDECAKTRARSILFISTEKFLLIIYQINSNFRGYPEKNKSRNRRKKRKTIQR